MRDRVGQSLSARQAEIAGMVARGKSSREIGQALYLSPRTVDAHIVAILEKLGLRSRIELAAAFFRLAGDDEEPANARAARTNLPIQRSNLLGREAAITDIVRALDERTIVTVTGAGGVGKTRTALAVADRLVEETPVGVWLVELAPIAQGSLVTSAIAQALRIHESPERPLLETLIAHLEHKAIVLILDNCEHVIAEVAVVADALLRACARLRILATSREPLRIAGEQTYRLPSLLVPSAPQAAHLRAAASPAFPAVMLFAQRARGSDHRFEVTDENAPMIAEICRRLDGIPLAIELAASRIAFMGLRQLRDRLDQRFVVLTRGNREALPRHQTIRALIDWSYNLLEEAERTLFRRLGIFADGFTLEAAIAVGTDERGGHILDVLEALVDKSLVVVELREESPRYRLLESTRVYASEKLAAAGERESVARLHLLHLRDHFAELRRRVERTAQIDELNAALRTELDNIRGALDGAAAASDVLVAGELLAQIRGNWMFLGLSREGIERIGRLLAALPANASRLRAILSYTAAHLLYENSGAAEALGLATQAVAHARASNDSTTLAAALRVHSLAALLTGRLDDAESSLAQAEAIPGLSPALHFAILRARAILAYMSDDLETAVRTDEQLLEEQRSLGDANGARVTALHLARHEHARGNTRRAVELMRDAISSARMARDTWLLPSLLRTLAALLAFTEELDEAAGAACEAIAASAGLDPDDEAIPRAIQVRALVVALQGDARRAAELAGYADATLQRLGQDLEEFHATTRRRLIASLREQLEPDEFERLIARGAALSSSAAVALALDLPLENASSGET